jgi:hypothetical protein
MGIFFEGDAAGYANREMNLEPGRKHAEIQ